MTAARRVLYMQLRDPVLVDRLIRRPRPELGGKPYTERSLAARINRSHSLISAFRRGRSDGRPVTCSAETAIMLSEALGVPVDVLFTTKMSDLTSTIGTSHQRKRKGVSA